MRYFFFVDESGPFDEKLSGARTSFVGGLCSTLNSTEWMSIHKQHLSEVNQRAGWQFRYPQHYHCGPLLGRSISGPLNASLKDLRDFTESVYHNVLAKALFAFGSKNRGKRFEYSAQATYVMNLVAALRFAFQHLAESRFEDIEHLTIIVAQRSIRETTGMQSRDKYMGVLLGYVREQMMLGEGAGVELARVLERNRCLTFDSGFGDQDHGLIAADFICCLARQSVKVPTGTRLHICNPDANVLLGDYRRFHERQVVELLRHAYYGSCLDFMCRFFPCKDGAPDLTELLRHLEMQRDAAILEREMPSLLAVIHQMAKHRTQRPHMLACSTAVAEQLVATAARQEKDLRQTNNLRSWLNLHVHALGELAACYNHTGAVGPQHATEQQLESLLLEYGKETGLGAMERQARLLEIKNRNLNLLFNDYRFEDAYFAAADLLSSRNAVIGKDAEDKLLGEMLGSYGQACAFMGRLEPEWYGEAEKAFKESLRHFAGGSRQESMSRNFLATLLWHRDELTSACEWLPGMRHPAPCEDALLACLIDRLTTSDPEDRAFEVVNCLRIMCRILTRKPQGHADTMTVLTSLESIATRLGTDHPYEQWWKWIGILHLLEGRVADAERCFCEAEALCDQHSFTMKTIGSSILLLRLVAAGLRHDTGHTNALQQRYVAMVATLRGESSGFTEYMSCFSDIAGADRGLHRVEVRSASFWRLCTYLPFAYS